MSAPFHRCGFPQRDINISHSATPQSFDSHRTACGGDMNRAATNQWEEKESAVWPSYQRCAAPTEEATSCESSSPPTESRSEPPPKASRICGVPLASAVFVRPRNHFRPSGLFLVFSQLWSDFSPHPVDFSPCRGLSRAKCFRCQMP